MEQQITGVYFLIDFFCCKVPGLRSFSVSKVQPSQSSGVKHVRIFLSSSGVVEVREGGRRVIDGMDRGRNLYFGGVAVLAADGVGVEVSCLFLALPSLLLCLSSFILHVTIQMQ